MATCNLCIHKQVCRFQYELLGCSEMAVREVATGKSSYDLTVTEIKHILAENCRYFKSVTEAK